MGNSSFKSKVSKENEGIEYSRTNKEALRSENQYSEENGRKPNLSNKLYQLQLNAEGSSKVSSLIELQSIADDRSGIIQKAGEEYANYFKNVAIIKNAFKEYEEVLRNCEELVKNNSMDIQTLTIYLAGIKTGLVSLAAYGILASHPPGWLILGGIVLKNYVDGKRNELKGGSGEDTGKNTASELTVDQGANQVGQISAELGTELSGILAVKDLFDALGEIRTIGYHTLILPDRKKELVEYLRLTNNEIHQAYVELLTSEQRKKYQPELEKLTLRFMDVSKDLL